MCRSGVVFKRGVHPRIVRAEQADGHKEQAFPEEPSLSTTTVKANPAKANKQEWMTSWLEPPGIFIFLLPPCSLPSLPVPGGGVLIPRDRPLVTKAPLAAIARAPAVKPPADASSHPPAQLVASMEVRPSTWPPVASIVPTVAHDDTTVYAEAGCPVWGWASTTSAARASPLNGARDEWRGNGTDAEAHITSVGRADTSGSSGRGESRRRDRRRPSRHK